MEEGSRDEMDGSREVERVDERDESRTMREAGQEREVETGG